MRKLSILLVLAFVTLSCSQKLWNSPSGKRGLANVVGKDCAKLFSNLFSFDNDTLPKKNLGISDALRDDINAFVRGLDSSGPQDEEVYKNLLKQLPDTFYSPEQNKMIKGVLNSATLSEEQKKTIFLIGMIGKYAKGSDEVLDYSESYSWSQIRRKAHLLKLVGFSLEERRKILWTVGDRYFTKMDNLFNFVEVDETVARLNNDVILNRLKNFVPDVEEGKMGSISRKEAQFIYDLVYNNPVSSLRMYDNYNPVGSNVGFCWGRAMTAQIEAMSRGVAPDSIKKIFAVGPLSSGSTNWRYHVTTIIKGDDGTWWAVDPIMGRVMTAKEWTDQMDSQYNKKGLMRVFLSEGDRYSPGQLGPYKEGGEDYNNYFYDLLNYFHYRPQATRLSDIDDANIDEIMKNEATLARPFPEDAPKQTISSMRRNRSLFMTTGVIGGGVAVGAGVLYYTD